LSFAERISMLDSLLHPGSYLGFFAVIALTGCGLPLPEEAPVILAGILSAQPDGLHPTWAFASCLLGALVGDSAMYAIGYRFGHSLVRRHPKLSKLLDAEDERQFEKAIKRHGFKVLLLARFMVGVRAPVYLAAGVIRMPYKRFLLWDLVCATAVVGVFFGLSHYFGQDIANMFKRGEVAVTALVVLAVAVVAFIALKRYRRRLIEKVLESAESLPTTETAAPDHREAM
jgi:membrane protein DedA with SNARE-associated domain